MTCAQVEPPMITKEEALRLAVRGSRTSRQLRQLHAILLVSGATTTSLYNSLLRAAPDPAATTLVYRAMLRGGHFPDHFSFPFAFKSLAQMPHRHDSLLSGLCLHAHLTKSGHGADVYVTSSLLHLYTSHAKIAPARVLFDHAEHRNVVTWTTMIAGYVETRRCGEAIELFKEMEAANVEINHVTAVHALSACAWCEDLETGRWLHARLRSWGMEPIISNVILATAVLDMYASSGGFDAAWAVLDGMPAKNEVSWNAMIGVCNRHGRPDKVLELFAGMHIAGMKPDSVSWLSILAACTSRGAMALGQGIHAYLEKTNGHRHVAVSTSLMDMYSKAGNSQGALQIFHCLDTRDVMAWTSMIVGLAKHGNGKDAVGLFNLMEQDGVTPDHVTFLGVLTACSHAGMVDEGKKYLHSMRTIYGIRPTIKHYGCLVDLLSRAGRLTEAEGLVQSMPIRPSISIWGSILNGCEIYGKADIAERIGRQVAELNPQCSGFYVLLSNMFAGLGRWHAVEHTRKLMSATGLKKNLGSSMTEDGSCS